MEHILVRRARRNDSSLQRKATLIHHNSLRDLSDPFNNPNFASVYRFTPTVALRLIDEIRGHYPDQKNSNSMPVELKFLAALHFYAQGSYQKPCGRDAAVSLSQASVSRAISETTAVLNLPQVMCKWIKFPSNSNERQQIIQKNYRKFNFPGVLGYVDGTYILIKKPIIHEEAYINRKGQHSLNVQAVCDSDLLIINILARYPGSTHDAFIWRASAVRDRMLNMAASCWLLGDSGYPLEPWLLTPVLNAEANSPEAQYTQLHIRSRNCIERCFGVLKCRFRCLHKHRTLEYAPTKVGHIVNACAVLHNVCIKNNIEEPEIEPIEISDDFLENARVENEIHNRAVQVRTDLINRLF